MEIHRLVRSVKLLVWDTLAVEVEAEESKGGSDIRGKKEEERERSYSKCL